ncbi:hypothetical protein Pmar_PMAR014719 [Perkinsus marinus ATCC 50983]|uniref:C3H1-type domain-containing protein n=1 Tax=Perkinsus marinus (strain ATCC 50983 / TXsc) TaxID=423536 RepID=C5LIU7_PERM5|nr:hypothetical protein Pmar_PMAR014719 [Perkinsus marinus ATCC 50983]EER03500.1 hypothetical protein Pmar_PMAR014719 [Perkinsus marinus ATCC 50983]|eukprot:XP_002771684.1 hypothetical protein Pmar_PMAR014719 [Perkinsus marinus ATCC 50983]
MSDPLFFGPASQSSSLPGYGTHEWSGGWGQDEWGWSAPPQWGNNDGWYTGGGGWNGSGKGGANDEWWPHPTPPPAPSWGKGYHAKGSWESTGYNSGSKGKGKGGKGKSGRRWSGSEQWNYPQSKKGRWSDEPQKSEFYCIPCGKDLFTADALDEHVITFHVTCPHPGCDYSARPDLVAAHKLSHCLVTTVEGKSESLTTSQAETDAWLARRKKNFPTKGRNDSPKGAFDANEMCTLEKAIRSSMRENRERKKKERAEREAKFAERRICTHFAKFGKCKYEGACHFEHVQPKKGVCRFFQERGYCRHGDNCKFNHIKKQEQPKESTHEQLIRRLMRDDIERYNATVLQCLRFFITENFFDEKSDTAVLDEDDSDSGQSDDSGDDDYFSEDDM